MDTKIVEMNMPAGVLMPEWANHEEETAAGFCAALIGQFLFFSQVKDVTSGLCQATRGVNPNHVLIGQASGAVIKCSLRKSHIAGTGVAGCFYTRRRHRPWLSAAADAIPGGKPRISMVTTP